MATGRHLLLLGAAFLGICGSTAALANEPSIPATTRAFKSLDENADGKIELAEIQPRAVRRFQKFDGNGDGEVIPTAFEADSFCGFTNRLISDSRLAGPGGGNASSSSFAR
jgi:hypothetical protein